jgi:hypothetical protein
MFLNSCTRMARQIRRLGYAKKLAEFMARIFCLDIILVWAVAGVLATPPVQYLMGTSGPAYTECGCPAAYYYAPFGIQR